MCPEIPLRFQCDLAYAVEVELLILRRFCRRNDQPQGFSGRGDVVESHSDRTSVLGDVRQEERLPARSIRNVDELGLAELIEPGPGKIEDDLIVIQTFDRGDLCSESHKSRIHVAVEFLAQSVVEVKGHQQGKVAAHPFFKDGRIKVHIGAVSHQIGVVKDEPFFADMFFVHGINCKSQCLVDQSGGFSEKRFIKISALLGGEIIEILFDLGFAFDHVIKEFLHDRGGFFAVIAFHETFCLFGKISAGIDHVTASQPDAELVERRFQRLFMLDHERDGADLFEKLQSFGDRVVVYTHGGVVVHDPPVPDRDGADLFVLSEKIGDLFVVGMRKGSDSITGNSETHPDIFVGFDALRNIFHILVSHHLDDDIRKLFGNGPGKFIGEINDNAAVSFVFFCHGKAVFTVAAVAVVIVGNFIKPGIGLAEFLTVFKDELAELL